jgi:hypothetical protein
VRKVRRRLEAQKKKEARMLTQADTFSSRFYFLLGDFELTTRRRPSTLRVGFIFHFSPVFLSQIAVLCMKKSFKAIEEMFQFTRLEHEEKRG